MTKKCIGCHAIIYAESHDVASYNVTNMPCGCIFQIGNSFINEIDNVNHPKHYTSGDSKCSECKKLIECIDVTRHMSFNIGNAIKYLWRHEHKNGTEDLKKAIWYINDEIRKRDEKGKETSKENG